MKTFIHKTGALMLAVAFALAPVAPAMAVQPDPANDLHICHATGSGFVKNSPSKTADAGGHAGAGHQDGRDIIPPFEIDGGGSFPGQNWDAEGQDIWNSGECDGDGIVGPTTGKLTVTKTVSGGTAQPNDFLLKVGNTSVQSGVANDFAPASYTVSETNLPNYSAGSWGGDCAANGSVTLAAGDNKTCTITNTYVPQVVYQCNDGIDNDQDEAIDFPEDTGCESATDNDETNSQVDNTTITILKQTTPEGDAQTFTFEVNDVAFGSAIADNGSTGAIEVATGSKKIEEIVPTGWTMNSISCVNEAQQVVGSQDGAPYYVTLGAGDDITCTVTNTKNEVPPPPQNSCLEPTTDGVQEDFVINASGETSVQQMLNAEFGNGVVNATTDQIDTQTWDVTTLGADTVTLKVKILGQYAGLGQQFGYYTAGNAGSFTAIPVVNNSTEVEVTIPATAVIGFADQTGNTWFSESALNSDGAKDHVAVYNPSANVYVIAFEDLVNLGDKDHNDLVVKVTVVSCNNEDPTYTIDGYKFNDEDGDGYRDEGENGIAGWTINLLDDEDEVVESTTTDATGYYYFVVEDPWNHTVEEVMQSNWEQTAALGRSCENNEEVPYFYDRIVRKIVPFFADDSSDDVEEDYSCDFYNHYTAPMCEVVVVSDVSNTVDEKGDAAAKLVTFIHGAWTASISGASWIWGDDPVANPAAEATQTFTKTFVWDGPVTDADLVIAADNSYSVTLNGSAAGADATDNNFAATDSHDVSGLVQQGVNTLKFTVTNKGGEYESPTENPAGLLYKVTVKGTDETCGEVPPPGDPETPNDGGGSNGGGGGGKRISMSSSDGEVLGDSDEKPEPEVAGAQTAVLPAGAPNTGMGGATNTAAAATMLGSFVTMLAGVVALRRKTNA